MKAKLIHSEVYEIKTIVDQSNVEVIKLFFPKAVIGDILANPKYDEFPELFEVTETGLKHKLHPNMNKHLNFNFLSNSEGHNTKIVGENKKDRWLDFVMITKENLKFAKSINKKAQPGNFFLIEKGLCTNRTQLVTTTEFAENYIVK